MPGHDPIRTHPGAAASVAETLAYRYEPADTTYAEALANRTVEHAAATAEIAQLRAQLAQVDQLRDEIARLAPDNGRAPGHAELLSILDTARHTVDYPMTDRCGCGWTDDTARVRFHRRGSDQCRADQ